MAERSERMEARLLSSVRPTKAQEERFLAFLRKKYGPDAALSWQQSDAYPNGFRLEAGAEVYDWSAEGRLSQFKSALEQLAAAQGDVIPLLKETVLSWTPQAMAQEIGTVLTVGDGIARVDGLAGAAYGEILLFDGGVRGMVQDLSEESVGCILFDDDAAVSAGSTVHRTGRTAGVPVGEGFLGRVVNALGVPIDGGGDVRADGYRAVESPAAASASSSSATARPARPPSRSTPSSTRRARTSSASTSPSGRRRAPSPSCGARWKATARWTIPSSSTPRRATRRRCSTSRPMRAAPWANTL